MQRQISSSHNSDSDRAEHHIAFSIRPFDPPSSPPPTSPLPPLPEIALYSHASAASTPFPIQPVFTLTRPVRPPRPQTSLPNLTPRIITSPGVPARQRHSEITISVGSSPTPTSRRQKSLHVQGQGLRQPIHGQPIRLTTPTPSTISKVSDDVLSALPRLFDRFLPSQYSPGRTGDEIGQSERIEPWRVYHSKLTQASSKPSSQRKRSRRPVTRSALFIPGTPPKDISRLKPSMRKIGTALRSTRDTCHVVQNTSRMATEPYMVDRSTSLVVRQPRPNLASNKRSRAVTSFAFNFGNFEISDPCNLSPNNEENITSLPRIPSDPVLLLDAIPHKKKDLSKVALIRSLGIRNCSEETITFAALPYVRTSHSAGPRPKTEKDYRVRVEDADYNVETGEEDVRQLTEEEAWIEARKRFLWAVVTVTLVVIATGGILIGIIWKLRSLT